MKLNNLSRLTALLLALTMFLSSVAWADPVAEGDYTADNYAEMLAAQTDTCAICVMENEFPTTDHNGNTISITCGYEYLENLGSPMERYHFLNYHYQQVNSAVLSALYSVHTQHVEAGAENLWCNCAEYWSDFKEPGAENHEETCPWVDDTVVIIPNIPQPDPVNPDLFEQYTSNEEYDLPMAGDRAIILPEGGRAVIKSNKAAGYQWQVYDGTQWVGIAGETGADLVVTTAKLATIFDLTSIAEIRYFDAANDIVMASVSVVSQEIAGGEYVEPVAEQTLFLTEREGETAKTYNVVINYQYENGAIVDNPYTANLAAGSSFSATVTFPVVQGYLAYFGTDTSPSTSYDLSITDIQADVTYTVTYLPTDVEYIVYHYQQNIYDDKYSEATGDSPQYLQGLTGSQVPAVHNTYDGFYHLLYEQPNIAADGSTKVVVYYDRYYYLMTFDLDGGYGVEPIYTRFGAAIGDIPTPTKAGYIFGGWDLVSETVDDTVTTYEDGVADEVYAETPAKNVHYKAIWTAKDTAKVSIVIWGENADDEGYSYYDTIEDEAKPGTQYIYGGATLTCDQEAHKHEADCLKCTEEEHTHTEKCYTRICTKEEHEHSSACCTLDEHSHNDDCYKCDSWDHGMPWHNCTTLVCEQTEHTHGDGECVYCSKEVHTHTDYTGNCYELTCTTPEHEHTADCYSCGKTEHTHNADCFENDPAFPVASDTHLWTFVGMDVVTVEADGSTVVNVYYDRTYFTLYFRDEGDSTSLTAENAHGTIYEKWGADIREKYNAKSTLAGTALWSLTSDGEDPWTSFLDIMPQENRIYFANSGSGSTQTAYYYGQSLEEAAAGATTYSELLYTSSAVYNGTLYVGDEDKVPITGFTYVSMTGTNDQGSYRFHNAKFYYTRNRYTLVLNNGETNQYVFSSDTTNYPNPTGAGVLYEAPLSTYDVEAYTPTLPSFYEPGSRYFAGWYLNKECTGAEYDLSAHTMPADNLILYAKWAPVEHQVTFYLDETKYLAEEPIEKFQYSKKYTHNALIGEVSPPDNGSYKIVGWFYMDGDEEKAFDPENMPIKHDLQVYAKWSSNVLEEYVIFYKLKDANGNPVLDENGKEIEIADQISASGLAGTTKTFDAKANDELYADYQEGYFTLTPSHSLIIDINVPDEPNGYNWYEIDGEIVQGFTFWYVEKPAVPYTVKYLNAETGEALHAEMTVSDNKKAVVTETFEPISGYMPDAYQKRLVVSGAEGAVNEIIFYYTKDELHAYYQITHYTQNLEGGGYTEYASSQAVGDIGKQYTGTPMTIQGFTYKEIKYLVDGVEITGNITDKGAILTAQGLDIRLYYDRNTYPYEVRYLEQGSGKVLHDPKTAEDGCTGLYGDVVSEEAVRIENYELVSNSPKNITIQVEAGNEVTQNIITFYYKEKTATINYVVVGPDGCGTVNLVGDTDIADRDDLENVKVVTGLARGATAALTDPDDQTYRFVGWYDEAGNLVSVNATWIPTKDDDKVWPDSTTYYAKFEYNLTSMTIWKAADEETTISSDETFIFTVTGPGLENGLKVIVQGTGSVVIGGLTVGQEYTVTEDTAWSWRYDAVDPQKITLASSDNKVVITNSKTEHHWLSDEGTKVNKFNEQKPQGGEQQ